MSIMTYRGPKTNASGETTVNASEHEGALRGRTNDFGRAMRKMLEGWEAYARAHQDAYDAKIGDDGVMGDYWAEAGLAIKRLLDGQVGGFDCGSLAQNITEAIEAQGIKTDGIPRTD